MLDGGFLWPFSALTQAIYVVKAKNPVDLAAMLQRYPHYTYNTAILETLTYTLLPVHIWTNQKEAAYLQENLSILKSSSSCSDYIQLCDVQCRNPTCKDIFDAADVLIPLSVKHEPAETHSSHCKSSVSKRRSSKGELTKKGRKLS